MTAATAPAPPRKRSDLGVRTVTGLTLVVVALGCIVFGGNAFWILISLACLVMMTEWAAMMRAERWQMWLALAGLAPVLLLFQPNVDVADIAAPIVLAATVLAVLALTRRPRLALGMVYAGLPTIALVYLERQFDGVALTLWTIGIVVATDVGAYFSGRTIGGPKLAPSVSPNKTWAGLIGGMLAAVIAGVALAHLLHAPRQLAGFAGLLAIAAQGGDLYESAMKRRAGVKDSGRILPGHGGVMDRLDGMVPVICLVAGIIAMGIL